MCGGGGEPGIRRTVGIWGGEGLHLIRPAPARAPAVGDAVDHSREDLTESGVFVPHPGISTQDVGGSRWSPWRDLTGPFPFHKEILERAGDLRGSHN